MLESRIPEIIATSTGAVAAAVKDTVNEIERGAKSRSRVDTGHMRGGWQNKMIGFSEGVVFNLVDYTIYNEYGTVNMSAQPMLRPAVEQAEPRFAARLAECWR